MKFPSTNKLHKKFSEQFGENAKLLEERIASLNWKVWAKAYAIGLSVFLATLFLIIATVRLANKLF